MKFKTILASDIAVLDSNVITGGGTDDTAALQTALDEAGEDTGVRLIMDGAALITGLKLKSNTVIECLSKDCGFYLKDWSDCAIVSNYDMQFFELRTRNISLIGGSYNQNCVNQVHHRDVRPDEWQIINTSSGCRNDGFVNDEGVACEEKVVALDANEHPEKWIFAIELYGIQNLLIRDIEIIDHRSFGVTIGGFKNVTIENVWFTLYNQLHSNQDGLHFWGPGQFLTVKNVGGTVGDDFMNIGSDEMNSLACASITDVLVDGVFLDHADQAIRLLSRGEGRLDRITIRNVTGTYSSFGFFISSWFTDGGYGNFGDILIENVNLTAIDEPVYNYRKPVLFSIGCNLDCLTLKNIRYLNPIDNRAMFEIGVPGFVNDPPEYPEMMHQKNIIIDGLTILEDEAVEDLRALEIYANVENLTIKNITVRRNGEKANTGKLVEFKSQGSAELFIMRDAYIKGFDTVIDDQSKINRFITSDVVTEK